MIGRTVSQYRIVEELGRGGMGVAYLGRDVRLRRPVVLKFLAARLGSEEHARRRFEREARAASSLDHPHICTIYEIDETEDGQQFIAMAYYPGESLEDRLLRGPLPAADAVELASQIASGLGRAHSRGLVHRDVKPGNILISDEGEAKILDFGLARIAGEGGESGELPVGTPAYMAPEQLRGEPVDERSDQWALGALVYEMLVGEPPFTGDKLPALMHAVVSAEAEPPSEVTSSVPPALDPVVMRALSKDPEARHGDVETFARELRRAFGLSSATFGGLPEGPPPPKPSPWRSLAWLGAGALGATLLATALWTLRRPETVPPPVPSIVRTQPLARESGLETAPAWGPGGRLLAYGSDQDGNMDVWLRQRSSGTTRNLTGDHPGFDGNPVISPDGERVAFVSDRGGGGIYSISVLGGPAVEIAPVRLLPSTEARIWIPSLAFSPDGSVLAHSGTFLDPGLFLVDAEGGEPRRIELVDDGSATQPSWSPDGGRLAYASVTGTGTSVASLWTLPVAGGTPTRLTRGTSLDIQPVWSSEGDRIYFLSDRGGSSDVWWLEVDADGAPASEPRALTSGIGIGGFALSGDVGLLGDLRVGQAPPVTGQGEAADADAGGEGPGLGS
ncbi:MAG: protein kinase, partial [Acidobacteriota bacterium]